MFRVECLYRRTILTTTIWDQKLTQFLATLWQCSNETKIVEHVAYVFGLSTSAATEHNYRLALSRTSQRFVCRPSNGEHMWWHVRQTTAFKQFHNLNRTPCRNGKIDFGLWAKVLRAHKGVFNWQQFLTNINLYHFWQFYAPYCVCVRACVRAYACFSWNITI